MWDACLTYNWGMKVVLFMAVSLNGMIAREDNSEDFLSEANWKTLVGLTKKTGCLVWGRKTYELVKKWDKSYLKNLAGVKKIIVSSDKGYRVEEGLGIASSPEEALGMLAKAGFREVVLTGGSKLNTSFAKASLINEVVLNMEAVIIGKGIPIFYPEEFELDLDLRDMKKISKRLIQMKYKVN